MKTEYVVGFLFSRDKSKVVLIKKNRPTWQAGKMNGVGGHVERTDISSYDAMSREFREETGVKIPSTSWKKFAYLEGSDFNVECFCTTGDVTSVQTRTDEEVHIVDVQNTNFYDESRFVENLSWLIPLAIDCLNDMRPNFTVATYG